MAKSLKDVCKRLEPDFQGFIDAYRYEGIENDAILTYSLFERRMMEDGWILSDKTVQQKWKLLRSNGIISDLPYRTDRAKFHTKAYCAAVGYVCYTVEKNKKIIFEQAADEQGADA